MDDSNHVVGEKYIVEYVELSKRGLLHPRGGALPRVDETKKHLGCLY